MLLKTFTCLLAVGISTLAACSPVAPASTATTASAAPSEEQAPSETRPPSEAQESAAIDCAAGGARLPISNICMGLAIRDLGKTIGSLPETPAECTWTVNETAFPLPQGEGVLLYRALTCNSVTTKLEYRAGAPAVKLGYVASALEYTGNPVTIFGGGGQDPRARIEALKADIPDKALRESCELQPTGVKGWPTDALVLEQSVQARAKAPKDQVPVPCGEYGVYIDSDTFWRVAQGYAWYFDLGPDSIDFDPSSFLLMKKTASGEWQAVQ